jgi:hypothetical protein
MSDSNNAAAQALSSISARVYRAQAIVATSAVAAGVNESQEGLELRGALEIASELLLEIASDVAMVERRIELAPKSEERHP